MIILIDTKYLTGKKQIVEWNEETGKVIKKVYNKDLTIHSEKTWEVKPKVFKTI
jgi:hypothetical protein